LIESRTTRRFREAFADFPEEIRQQARQAYLLFRQSPHHPSLRFKKVDEESNTFSVRTGLGYPALGPFVRVHSCGRPNPVPFAHTLNCVYAAPVSPTQKAIPAPATEKAVSRPPAGVP
jgi:hypothetical protein